jgi:HSP20 family protein
MNFQVGEFAKWNHLVRHFLGEDFFEDIVGAVRKQEPLTDVYHGKREVIVVVDLPGLERVEAVKMQVEGDTLHLRGEFPTPYRGYEVQIAERKKGEFHKQIPLGTTVSRNSSTMRYRKGVLEIRFPKE